MIGKYDMLLVPFIILLKLAWAESGFSCHSSLNVNGSGSLTVTGEECKDFSFKDNDTVLEYGTFLNGQAVYEFSDCVTKITFVCNTPSRGTAVCENECPPKHKPEEISGRNNTADGGGLSARRIVGIVIGVVLIVAFGVVVIVLWKNNRFKRCFQCSNSVI